MIIVTQSLVASCVWLKLEPSFSLLVSSAKVCSSPAPKESQNAFVASDIFTYSVIPYLEVTSRDYLNTFVCSVIWYLEASSREYLVASNERLRLQCDVVF